MAYLNKVMLIGNIGKDPEIRVSPNGRKRVSLTIATSRRYRDNNGEQKEQTEWHNLVGWGKTADIFEQLGIRKGMSLYVEGWLSTRSWTDTTTGFPKYITEVNIDTFQLLTQKAPAGYWNNRGTGDSAPQGQTEQQGAIGKVQDAIANYDPAEEDDLPF